MKRFYLSSGAAVAALVLSSLGTANASTISIVRHNDAEVEMVGGIRDDTSTYGSDLAGARIYAHYADGTNEEIIWESHARTFVEPNGETWSTTEGGASGTDIDLSMTWDGFVVTTRNVLSYITIDLLNAGVVFDTTTTFDYDWMGNPTNGSTLGSSFGYGFEYYDEYEPLPGHTTASYYGVVNEVGEEAVGDLYTTMTVDFSGMENNGIFGDVAFRSDLDALSIADGLSQVPLPSSLSLLLLGLGGLGLRQRHLNRAKARA
ncbi:PEP-CTERM sorting domain-containing protein [uncultured Tateyamaria sp.]|uniref:PEP-CTERM sorting domain-containing protein n=1 Tax=uncultured Tateyamaria sp. TaxID=455651 RepID=UPI00261C475B|nr:PEP-CTERM sorting domain-containing protein [uncultured Tateyamaria sp.]